MPIEYSYAVLALLVGASIGAFITWTIASRVRTAALEHAALRFEVARAQLDGRVQALEAEVRREREAAAEKLAALGRTRDELGQAFKALSAEALHSNNRAFLQLAHETLGKFQEAARGDLDQRRQAIEQVVRPVREQLDKFDTKVQELEKSRVGAYESLAQQVRSLAETQTQLRSETANLVKALRQPHVRGRWGEMQLRRVVEMAGMLDHCDFYAQETATTDQGRRVRPDLIVRLPGNRNVVVDSKVPLAAYLEALEADDDELRRARLADHARQLRGHLAALGRKSYWDQFRPTPEFVVLFVPGDTFYGAALEQDPALLEFGVEQRVILATPATLIALLRAVAYGWRQDALAENAKQISALGAELYKRLGDMGGHWTTVGASLTRAIDAYNRAVGSLESRVLVSARKFRDFQAVPGDVPLDPLPLIETLPRALRAEELLPVADFATSD